jgi:hypothetical protein
LAATITAGEGGREGGIRSAKDYWDAATTTMRGKTLGVRSAVFIKNTIVHPQAQQTIIHTQEL